MKSVISIPAVLTVISLLILPSCASPAPASPTAMHRPTTTTPVVKPTSSPSLTAMAPTAALPRKPSPAANATAIPWDSAVAILKQTPIAAVPTPAAFGGGTGKTILNSQLGAAVTFSGQVYQVTETDGNTYLAVETAENVLASDPVLVMSRGQLAEQPDRRVEVDFYATYTGIILAADRFGINVEMPVVRSHKIVQTTYPVYPSGLGR